MSIYKCIIFDCDGVLVDSETIANQVMVEMANELGANINLDYAMTHFKGNALNNCVRHIQNLISEPISQNFESEYRNRSFEAFKKGIKPVPHVKEVLESLKVPFCVASSGPKNKIELNLEITGLLPYFKNRIFSCYTIKKWKPDPDVFLWAAKSMGFEPQECLVIEDSTLGVVAARHGGFPVFGFTAQDYKDELSKISDKVFNSMLKLPDLLLSND